MHKYPIPIIDPNRFVKEFIPSLVWPETKDPAIQAGMRLANFFSISRLENYVQHIRFPIPVSRNFHYDLFLVTNGQLTLTDGLQTTDVVANSLVIRAAGAISGIDRCSRDLAGFYVLFDAEYVLYNLRNQNTLNELPYFDLNANPTLPLSAEDTADLKHQITKIETRFLRGDASRQAFISAQLYSLLLEIAGIYENQRDSDPPRSSATNLTIRFRDLLKQHILSKRTVRDYADLLHVTPNHLNRCVKHVTGKPVSSWITDSLVLEAKILLRQTDLSITEIAFHLNIADVSYFSRLFRKHTHMSPSEFRQHE